MIFFRPITRQILVTYTKRKQRFYFGFSNFYCNIGKWNYEHIINNMNSL